MSQITGFFTIIREYEAMNLPEKRIEMVHLQLTRKCNLRCYFCGQWGRKGFFAGGADADMRFEDWRGVIDSLIKYREKSGVSPDIVLWGGEPLMYPEFKEIVEILKDCQFQLGLITNGTLIDKYAELIRDNFKTVYISIDGPREIHDRIRGKGTFDKIAANVKLLHGGNAKIVFMSVISPENIDIMPEIPYMLEKLWPDKIILQRLIFLSTDECHEYEKWLKSAFGAEAVAINAWIKDDAKEYLNKLEKNSAILQRDLQANRFSVQVEYLPHGAETPAEFCIAPFRRLHVAYNGDVMYCTDFYDFKAGNVRQHDLIDIFNNKLSEKFRGEIAAGRCSTCNHCSWKTNRNYRLD